MDTRPITKQPKRYIQMPPVYASDIMDTALRGGAAPDGAIPDTGLHSGAEFACLCENNVL